MGVRDLGTIVKKYAPTAVTRYASLSAFKGCRFAIDANLLTTKFHFVKSSNTAPGAEEPDADPHRHVRSWYYFLRALEREDILPIVVFDGDTRVPEKERENARRRAARAEQRARGQAENTRGERLRELKDVWSGVARDDRQLVARALKQVEAGPKRLDDIAPDSTPEPVLSDQTGDDLPPARVLPSDEPEPVIDIVPTTESEPVIENEASSIAAPRLEPEVITVDQPEPAIDVVKPSPVTTGEQQSGLSVDERLKPQVDSLKTLYASFRQDETNPVYSRNQAIVTIEEKSFYSFILAQEKGDDSDIIDDGEELAQVIAKSDKLGSSHRSRAMGVPSSAFQDTMVSPAGLGFPHSLTRARARSHVHAETHNGSRCPLCQAFSRRAARSRRSLLDTVPPRLGRLRRFRRHGRGSLWRASAPEDLDCPHDKDEYRYSRRGLCTCGRRGEAERRHERARSSQVARGPQHESGTVCRFCAAVWDGLH